MSRIKSKIRVLYEKFCNNSLHFRGIISQLIEWAIFILILHQTYVLGKSLRMWWHPDYVGIGDYLNVKLPQALIGGGALLIFCWAADLFTPGSWIRKTKENAYASAIVLSALILGMAHIMAR